MAIAFDAATDGGLVNPGTSLTWSHTVTGSNRILRVGCFGDLVSGDATGVKITGATADAVAMNLITKIAENNGATPAADRWVYLFELPGIAAGSVAIAINASSSIAIGGAAASYNGAAQTGQPDAFTTNFTNGTTLTTSLSSIADNCWFGLVAKQSAATPTAGTGATTRVTSTSGIVLMDSNGPKTPAGSYSMTADAASTGDFAIIMASFSPFVSGGGPTYPQLERSVRGLNRGLAVGAR